MCRKGSSPFLGTFFKKIKQKAFNMKTQTISRCDLSAIYPLVCDGWKKKIAEHLVEQCNTDTIVVSNDLIKQAYAAADNDQKKLLQKHFDISFGRPTTLAGIAKELVSLKNLFISSLKIPKTSMNVILMLVISFRKSPKFIMKV